MVLGRLKQTTIGLGAPGFTMSSNTEISEYTTYAIDPVCNGHANGIGSLESLYWRNLFHATASKRGVFILKGEKVVWRDGHLFHSVAFEW